MQTQSDLSGVTMHSVIEAWYGQDVEENTLLL